MIIADTGIELAKCYDDARAVLPDARLKFDASRAEFVIVAGPIKIYPDNDIIAWRFVVEQRRPGATHSTLVGAYADPRDAFAAAAAILVGVN